jgi:hypothetical protein
MGIFLLHLQEKGAKTIELSMHTFLEFEFLAKINEIKINE